MLDPAGYFVIFPDTRRVTLVVEHYRNSGVLDHVLEGQAPADIYATAIELGLLTRLDRAAYLGCELPRAAHALRTGEPFVQDAALGDDLPPPASKPPPAPPDHT